MTQQFKFGDRVKYGATDFLFIYDKGDGRAHVVSETGVSGAALISDLTLIPHPDTVRLDWLAKNDCSLTERLCDEDKDLLDNPFAVIQIQENHCEVLAAASNIHDAIDAAMKQERGK